MKNIKQNLGYQENIKQKMDFKEKIKEIWASRKE